jgi:hypothetical protein
VLIQHLRQSLLGQLESRALSQIRYTDGSAEPQVDDATRRLQTHFGFVSRTCRFEWGRVVTAILKILFTFQLKRPHNPQGSSIEPAAG